VRVHAIVDDLETARRAVAAGATVVQLRVKAPTGAVVERGHGFTELGVTFVVNDDVEAAILLDADGVRRAGCKARMPATLATARVAATAGERMPSNHLPCRATLWLATGTSRGASRSRCVTSRTCTAHAVQAGQMRR